MTWNLRFESFWPILKQEGLEGEFFLCELIFEFLARFIKQGKTRQITKLVQFCKKKIQEFTRQRSPITKVMTNVLEIKMNFSPILPADRRKVKWPDLNEIISLVSSPGQERKVKKASHRKSKSKNPDLILNWQSFYEKGSLIQITIQIVRSGFWL